MIPVNNYLILAAILFGLSLVGIMLNRKNIILLLVCIELMLLAVNTNFVAFSHFYGGVAGEVFVFFILTVAAAEAAGLHQMILRFPKGYDTPIGEAGGLLSGGQRQRIGLARAMYGEPELVVLDEPNANLDEDGEIELVRAVQGMKNKGKTVVLISHRPGIVRVADRLLILQQGIVQASGPRDGVLAALQQQRENAQSLQTAP